MPAPTAADDSRGRTWRKALTLSALFCLILLGRFIFVSIYAESVPFWDQWDAEGKLLIKPWLEGRLGVSQMLAAHNEHRILLTRLISLALLEANNRQWDNLVSAYVNVALYAANPVLLFAVLSSGLRTRSGRALLFIALLALAWLPYGWENSLVGFQSQFYLMSLLAIWVIVIAAKAADNIWLPLKLLVPAVFGLFTMATGFLGLVSAGAVLTLRALGGQLRVVRGGITVCVLAGICLVAFAFVPHISGHDSFRAHGLNDWLSKLSGILGWPAPHSSMIWPLIWLPTLLTIWAMFRDRRVAQHELVALGLSFWTLLQIASIAYSRGVLSSRYLDTVSVGVIANLWMALHFSESWRQTRRAPTWRWLGHAPLGLLVLCVGFGLAQSTPSNLASAGERHRISIRQTINVRAFVSSGDRAYLDNQPPMHIPYPSPDILAGLLNDKTLRAALPASVRKPLPLKLTRQNGAFTAQASNQQVSVTTCDATENATCLGNLGSWETSALATTFPYVQVPISIEGTNSRGLTIAIEDGHSNSAVTSKEVDRAQRLILETPRSGAFRLSGKDSSTQASLTAWSPIEVGRLSRWSMLSQDFVRNLFHQPATDEQQKSRFLVSSPSLAASHIAFSLPPGKLAQIEWISPRGGKLTAVAIPIGNYGNLSDGTLILQACIESGCQFAQTDVTRSVDNSDIELVLAAPLPLQNGTPLTLRFWTLHATEPLALWTEQGVSGSSRIRHLGQSREDQLAPLTLPLTLTLQD